MLDYEMTIEEICELFYEKVKSILGTMVPKEQVEDLAQEVFVKIARGLPAFEHRSKLSTWIYRIAVNTGRDWLRSIRRESDKRVLDIDIDCQTVSFSTMSKCDNSGPVRHLIHLEMTSCIQEQINKLPEKYRSVIMLNSLDDLTQDEIAEILDLSLETVKVRIYRGREKLRKILEQQCRFYIDQTSGSLACDRKYQQ